MAGRQANRQAGMPTPRPTLLPLRLSRPGGNHAPSTAPPGAATPNPKIHHRTLPETHQSWAGTARRRPSECTQRLPAGTSRAAKWRGMRAAMVGVGTKRLRVLARAYKAAQRPLLGSGHARLAPSLRPSSRLCRR